MRMLSVPKRKEHAEENIVIENRSAGGNDGPRPWRDYCQRHYAAICIMPQSVASTKMHNLVLSCYVVNISSNAHAAPKLVSVQLDSDFASFKFHTLWISVENTDVQTKISDDGFALA